MAELKKNLTVIIRKNNYIVLSKYGFLRNQQS